MFFLLGSFSSTSGCQPLVYILVTYNHLLLSISSCCLTCSCSYTRIFSIPISSQNSWKTTSSTFENREIEQKKKKKRLSYFVTRRCKIFNHFMLQTGFLRHFKKTVNSYWEVTCTWNFQITLSGQMPDVRHMWLWSTKCNSSLSSPWQHLVIVKTKVTTV